MSTHGFNELQHARDTSGRFAPTGRSEPAVALPDPWAGERHTVPSAQRETVEAAEARERLEDVTELNRICGDADVATFTVEGDPWDGTHLRLTDYGPGHDPHEAQTNQKFGTWLREYEIESDTEGPEPDLGWSREFTWVSVDLDAARARVQDDQPPGVFVDGPSVLRDDGQWEDDLDVCAVCDEQIPVPTGASTCRRCLEVAR